MNIGQFVQQFNERTRELAGTIVPVVITVFSDRSFTFEVKSPPAAILLKKAASVAKGSAFPAVPSLASRTLGNRHRSVNVKPGANIRSLQPAAAAGHARLSSSIFEHPQLSNGGNLHDPGDGSAAPPQSF